MKIKEYKKELKKLKDEYNNNDNNKNINYNYPNYEEEIDNNNEYENENDEKICKKIKNEIDYYKNISNSCLENCNKLTEEKIYLKKEIEKSLIKFN